MHYSDKFAEERDDSKESHLAYTTPPPLYYTHLPCLFTFPQHTTCKSLTNTERCPLKAQGLTVPSCCFRNINFTQQESKAWQNATTTLSKGCYRPGQTHSRGRRTKGEKKGQIETYSSPRRGRATVEIHPRQWLHCHFDILLPTYSHTHIHTRAHSKYKNNEAPKSKQEGLWPLRFLCQWGSRWCSLA